VETSHDDGAGAVKPPRLLVPRRYRRLEVRAILNPCLAFALNTEHDTISACRGTP
jgi:hypothetical protein